MKNFYLFNVLVITLALGACSTTVQDGAPKGYVNFNKIPNAVPKELPKSKYGNPKAYTVLGKTYYVRNHAVGYEKRGIASWYGTKFYGQYTSTRDRYNLYAMTAAMRTIPIPAYVQVTNLENGRKVIVKVNDRGPFDANRIIDLSYAAAGKLGMLQKGTALVDVKVINPRTWDARANAARSAPVMLSHAGAIQHPGKPILFIQVGAYSDKANAERVLHQIRHQLSEPTRIERAGNDNHMLYRVQVGSIHTVDASDSLTNRLKKIGFHNAMAIIE